jgi:tetratricopeptide (TPR) repeat protein
MQGPPLAAFAERRSGVEMAETARYRAFISYSHRDAAFAARLHRRLEGYRLPAHLAPGGDRRLSPIFKDREELPAASDLSTQVQAALAVSDVLIIVCSPDAAASPWVGREIETFRALHPDRPVLAALVRGEPAEAFHPALSASGAEPLAADFRKAGDGERLAFLKLVAGLAGVGLDRLIQRDAQRRLRGVIAVTAASVTAMLAMGTMLIFALDARAEAERQRGEAEGLVDFMLTDLRDRLEGVGRLDAMTAVNQRALAYYAKQDLDRLPPESLLRRAALLHAMGEDEVRLGNLDEAERLFAEARRITAALVTAEPDNADRIFAHAQSEYWSGNVAFHAGDYARVEPHWNAYLSLAERMAALEPANPVAQQEVGYALGNLCTLAVARRITAQGLERCQSALQAMQVASTASRTGPLSADLANRHAWLADALLLSGDASGALAHRLKQQELLEQLLEVDPRHVVHLERWVGCQRALAGLEDRLGQTERGLRRLRSAEMRIENLIAIEPRVQEWRQQKRWLADTRSALEAKEKGRIQ